MCCVVDVGEEMSGLKMSPCLQGFHINASLLSRGPMKPTMHSDYELTSSVLRTELCLLIDPANSYIEALTVNMTVFGGRAFKQVIKVK